jgi:hypothetical protein
MGFNDYKSFALKINWHIPKSPSAQDEKNNEIQVSKTRCDKTWLSPFMMFLPYFEFFLFIANTIAIITMLITVMTVYGVIGAERFRFETEAGVGSIGREGWSVAAAAGARVGMGASRPSSSSLKPCPPPSATAVPQTVRGGLSTK